MLYKYFVSQYLLQLAFFLKDLLTLTLTLTLTLRQARVQHGAAQGAHVRPDALRQVRPPAKGGAQLRGHAEGALRRHRPQRHGQRAALPRPPAARLGDRLLQRVHQEERAARDHGRPRAAGPPRGAALRVPRLDRQVLQARPRPDERAGHVRRRRRHARRGRPE